LKESVFVKVARWIEHWLYRRSWRICGATQGIVQGIISKGITPEKVILLPNGADIQLFRALEFQNNGDRPHNFVYAGTHGFAHGTEVILHTAHKLRGRRDVLFVLVGDGADKPRLRRIASELKLDNLIFCDPIPFSEIPALLSRSYAALVTVSRGEFFNGTRSAKIFPAMASGRAVIHSGSGEGADLVLRAKAGIVTEPGDADALAEAVTWMIANPDETVAMGIRAREFIEREYSWARLVENWLSQIDDEVASKI
jgi:colanic acid biosynthesis glycosyl transferase WcaI